MKCKCGTTLKVRDELAGKRAKCPECEAVVQIAKPDSIPVKCSCGQILNAKRSLAGKQTVCPACRKQLVIPGATETPAAPFDDIGFDDALSNALATVPPPTIQSASGNDYWKQASNVPAKTSSTKKTKTKRSKGSTAQDTLVLVTAILCILNGLWHVGGLLRSLLLLGALKFMSLGGIISIVEDALAIGMLAAGIGLLAKQAWAQEMGPPIACCYLFLIGLGAVFLFYTGVMATMSLGASFGAGWLSMISYLIPALAFKVTAACLLLRVCQYD